jgi:hypothetical protein
LALGGSSSHLKRHHSSEKILRSYSSVVKPRLSDQNKGHRVAFCLNERGNNGLYKEILYDHIHVDKKFFLLTKEVERYILAQGEEAPHRIVATKKLHIPKVMFLAANGQPRWDAGRKVGMWPIARQILAQRSNRNRPMGTLE